MSDQKEVRGPILIVDDDEDVREDFRAVVERAGHHVQSVALKLLSLARRPW